MSWDWLPVSDGQFILWFKAFTEGLSRHSASLGLSTEDLMELDAEQKGFSFMLAEIQALRAEVQNRVDFKNLLRDGPEMDQPLPYPAGIILAERPSVAVRPGIVPRLASLIERLKSQSGYTHEIGLELGIESLGANQIPSSPQNISSVAENGMVRLDFVNAIWQGVIVEGQRGSEATWTILATVFQPPYVDAREPLERGVAESRRYRLRYVDSAEAVGGYSEVVQVIFPAALQTVSPPSATLI